MKLYALNLFKTQNLQNLENLSQIPKVLPMLDWDDQIKCRDAKSYTLSNASSNIDEILVKHQLQNPPICAKLIVCRNSFHSCGELIASSHGHILRWGV